MEIITKNKVLKMAHKLAKKFRFKFSSYNIAFSRALKKVWATIKATKTKVVSAAGNTTTKVVSFAGNTCAYTTEKVEKNNLGVLSIERTKENVLINISDSLTIEQRKLVSEKYGYGAILCA